MKVVVCACLPLTQRRLQPESLARASCDAARSVGTSGTIGINDISTRPAYRDQNGGRALEPYPPYSSGYNFWRPCSTCLVDRIFGGCWCQLSEFAVFSFLCVSICSSRARDANQYFFGASASPSASPKYRWQVQGSGVIEGMCCTGQYYT